MSEIDNDGFFKKLHEHRATTCCIEFKSHTNICQMNPFTYNISKPRKCEHCGAIERLTTGECAYCRQP